MSGRRGHVGAAALACALGACAGAQTAAEPQTTVISLEGLDGADPGVALATRLQQRRGVHRARFDLARAEVTVTAAASVDVVAEARALKDEEYRVVPGAGHGSYVAWTKPPAGADVRTVVDDGADVVDLQRLAVPGKVTLLDFSAKWCEPCRDLDAHVLGLLVSRTDLAYRKLEIVDWDSPLARHYLKGSVKLPYVVVYDASGKLAGVVSGLDMDRLDRLIGAAPSR